MRNIAPNPRLVGDHDGTVAARLTAVPGVQRVPTPRASLFLLRDFLDAGICAALIALIEADRRPSTVSDANGDLGHIATSETCDLAAAHPVVHRVEQAIAELTGIDPAYGEPLQGQRYAIGQEFKAHIDHFEPGGSTFIVTARSPGTAPGR